MKNIIFDVNVVLDLWLERRPTDYLCTVSGLLEFGGRDGYQCWVCAGSLHVLEYIARRELKKKGADPLEAKRIVKQLVSRLLAYARSLTIFGFQQDECLLAETDLEDAQIVRAATLLNAPTAIVTNEKRFPTGGTTIQQVTPLEAQAWIYDSQSEFKIDFVDLKTQQDAIRPDLERRIHTVLHHGKYILGPEVTELETQLCAYTDAKHAITCSSGTDALLMALMALEVGPGDAVFTTPFTFVATADVIARLGAIPVFVDIDPATYNIDPVRLEEAVGRCESGKVGRWEGAEVGRLRPKAVIAVDLYGLPCDYDAIEAVAKKYGLAVIQDGAQSFGAEYKGRRTGALGDISCTSFFPSKPLGGYGDGGACFTGNDDLAAKLRSIRVHGQGQNKYDTIRLGIKGRMDTLQAAIVLAKLAVYPQELKTKQHIANLYAQLLNSTSSPPSVPQGMTSAWALYTILCPSTAERSAIQSRLKEHGILNVVYYARPLHLQPVFNNLGYKPGDFPVSEDCASRVLSLPMHGYMGEEEVKRIVEVMMK